MFVEGGFFFSKSISMTPRLLEKWEYPEQKIWIRCLLILARNSNFLLMLVIWHIFLIGIKLSDKKLPLMASKKIGRLFQILLPSQNIWTLRSSNPRSFQGFFSSILDGGDNPPSPSLSVPMALQFYHQPVGIATGSKSWFVLKKEQQIMSEEYHNFLSARKQTFPLDYWNIPTQNLRGVET